MAEGQIQHSPVGAFFLLYTLFRRCENWKVPVLGRVRLKPTSFLLGGWANWHKTYTCNRVQCFWLFLFCAADVLYYSNFQKILINLFNYSIGMYCWKAYTASELITHVMKLSWTKRLKKKHPKLDKMPLGQEKRTKTQRKRCRSAGANFIASSEWNELQIQWPIKINE